MQDFFHESLLPIFLHEVLVAIYDGVKTGFVNFKKIVSDGGGVNTVVAHNPFRHVTVRFVISFSVYTAKTERNMNFL